MLVASTSTLTIGYYYAVNEKSLSYAIESTIGI
jgi:hypothetical protein